MPNYQVVEPGMSAKLNCTTTTGSVDLSEVTWYKDGRPLKTDVLRVRLETMANLVIRPVEKRDAGMYQCFVGGNLEMAQASAEIAVAETAPSLTQTFYQRSAKPGESISLQCQSKGRPLPTFSWERDQELLLSDRRVRITSVRISNQVISVLNVTRIYAEDSGLYGCRATNEAGSVAHWARVGVHGKIFVHQGLSNVTAVPGQEVRIQCRYGGFPVDSVSWYKVTKFTNDGYEHIMWKTEIIQY
ncbi:Down syndrome cell adhesion molecule homolog [Ixodes scapularis]|uniref:Down syndrome cell adhesion molecule homolog n=1 Tax=Ixodes scapularis TaxID=6945 RepID=UPI001A9E7BDF|nr:Down syndrome cell adhesion molecule homolog [Ixodes scapularis]